MRFYSYLLLAAGLSTFTAANASATIIYYQNFSVASGAGQTNLSNVSWTAYYGNASTVATLAGTGSSGTLSAMISGGTGATSASSDVNATVYYNGGDTFGFVPIQSPNGTQQFITETSEAIDRTAYTINSFTWYAASQFTGDTQQLAVEIGGQWYANTNKFSPPGGVSGSSFNTGSTLETQTFTTDSSSWDTLDFVPSTDDLTVGSATALPTGNIQAFGVYANIANNGSSSRTYIDNFEVNATAVPEPVSFAGTLFFGGFALLKAPAANRMRIIAAVLAVITLIVCVIFGLQVIRSAREADSSNTILPAPAAGAIAPALPLNFEQSTTSSTQPSIRCAIIGGMYFTGFWDALAKRYQTETGVRVDLLVDGPKNELTKFFHNGGVDVITMHSSDAMMNLIADGEAINPQPWMRNDMVIVGPPADPAGIKGMTDAAAALRKIAATHSPFVVHSSFGAQEVLLNMMEPNNIVLDAATTTVLFDDQQRSVLKVAGDKHAYTLVGRIPFRTGRLPNNGLILMVAGDERLRRPFVVAVANPQRFAGLHFVEATRFANWLRTPETQAWIAGFGRGIIDNDPLFFPVTIDPNPTSRSTN